MSETADLLNDLAETLELKLSFEADQHWDRYIFSPRFANDTPYRRYVETIGKEDMDLISRARLKAAELEGEYSVE